MSLVIINRNTAIDPKDITKIVAYNREVECVYVYTKDTHYEVPSLHGETKFQTLERLTRLINAVLKEQHE